MSIINRIFNKIFLILEQTLSKNWFNPFATLYINLRSMPFSQAIKLPIWVFGRPKFLSLSGHIVIDSEIKTGMICFNKTNAGPSNMGVQSEIANDGTIIFKGKTMIRTGNKIAVGYGAKLNIGDGVIIGDFINIGCFNSITIGNKVRIAHRSQIYDTNYHYVANLNKKTVAPLTGEIYIGKGCWICNSSTITKGAFIPDFSIVSSNSVVNKNFSAEPQATFFAGIPAKPLFYGMSLINNESLNKLIIKFYSSHPKEIYSLSDNFIIDDLL